MQYKWVIEMSTIEYNYLVFFFLILRLFHMILVRNLQMTELKLHFGHSQISWRLFVPKMKRQPQA